MSEALQTLTDAKIIDLTVNDVADRYTVGDMLGEGRFSQVFSATRGSKSVALKVVDMATLEEDEEAVEALVQEVSALRKAYSASGKHVPKVHEVLQTSDTVYVAMDQVQGCELFDMLADGPLSESSSRRLIAQLLSALTALHKHGVVHRDVKPENLMVSDVDDPSRARLVMIDFGYAAIVKSAQEPLEGLAGSPEYAAPEVLTWLDGDGEPYYASCDMWSVGVTAVRSAASPVSALSLSLSHTHTHTSAHLIASLTRRPSASPAQYVLLSAELPFEFPEEGDLAEHVRTAPIKFSQPLWQLAEGDEAGKEMSVAQEFIRACMRVDEKARLTAKTALQHKWFAPRADDGQSVAIATSKAAMAALRKRVSSITTNPTDAPKRVSRWFGRLAGRVPASPTKQQFWELKLGMPPRPEEQEGQATPRLATPRLLNAPAAPATAAKAAPSAAFMSPPPPLALSTRPTNAANAPAPDYLLSARKAVALPSDLAEESRIKQSSTPRMGMLPLSMPRPGTENAPSNAPSNAPLPSPRRALFLAPSPRVTAELPGSSRRVPYPSPHSARNLLAPPATMAPVAAADEMGA